MNRAGFSLLEFIIVLAILSIILTISIGFFIRYQRLEAFRGAVSQLVADLNDTRAQARKTAFDWHLDRTSSTAYSYGYGSPFLIEKKGVLPGGAEFDTTATYASSVIYNTPYGNVNASNKTIRLFRTSPDLVAKINIVGVTGKLVAVYE